MATFVSASRLLVKWEQPWFEIVSSAGVGNISAVWPKPPNDLGRKSMSSSSRSIAASTRASRTTSSFVPWIGEWAPFAKLFRALGLIVIGAYRTVGTTYLGGACRFTPSCSEYGAEAFRIHHPRRAFALTARRICRCRPGGGCGYDPVPPVEGLSHVQ